MKKENLAHSCKFNSECLELMANKYSLIYTISIFSAIIIGLILLGHPFGNNLTRFVLGVFGLALTILPLVFKEKIEKVHGYRNLSTEFKDLERDFLSSSKSLKNINKLKILTKKLADYPIGSYTKWRIKRKNETKT